MAKLHKSEVSKMSLIQPKRFRTWETGLFKMPRLETPHFQMADKVIVASGPSKFRLSQTGHFKLPHLENPRFEMGGLRIVVSGQCTRIPFHLSHSMLTGI